MMLEHYNQTGYQVAVHVRRGDVFGAEKQNTDRSKVRRFAKDEVYLEVARQVEACACRVCFVLTDPGRQTMQLPSSNSSKTWDVILSQQQ